MFQLNLGPVSLGHLLVRSPSPNDINNIFVTFVSFSLFCVFIFLFFFCFSLCEQDGSFKINKYMRKSSRI